MRLFDLRTGEPGRRSTSARSSIYQVAFDPTSGNLAAPARTREHRGLRVRRGVGPGLRPGGRPSHRARRRLRHRGGVEPRRRAARVVADNNLVHLYDAGGGHVEIGEPIESIDAPILAVAFSPDGTPPGDRELRRGRPAVVGRHPRSPSAPRSRATPGRSAASPTAPTGAMLAASTIGFGVVASGMPRRHGDRPGAGRGRRRPPSPPSSSSTTRAAGRPSPPTAASLAIPSFDGTRRVRPRTRPLARRGVRPGRPQPHPRRVGSVPRTLRLPRDLWVTCCVSSAASSGLTSVLGPTLR